jgi:hypothetical protein
MSRRTASKGLLTSGIGLAIAFALHLLTPDEAEADRNRNADTAFDVA